MAGLEECVPPDEWLTVRATHLVQQGIGTIEATWIPSPIDPVWETRGRHYTPYEVWSLFGWKYVSRPFLGTGNEKWST